MHHDIEAIFLDVGNTLRVVVEDEAFQAQARQQLMTLVGVQEPPETFFAQLDARWKAYRKWSFENLTEASEKELWTRFMLPDFPAERIAPLSGKLTRLWRDGLTQYFKAVVLSSKFRHRKPGPEIYWEAARRVGVAPARSAYVGDNPIRDVLGTRRAGFGMIIILMEPAKLEQEPPMGENKPDLIIHECSELLGIFPARQIPRDIR
jgi:putative hydrolase of the HAD superfamily